MKTKAPKKNMSIDDLAVMVANGFNGMEERFVALEEGQEQIKLKLDNVAYRFELVELQRRVDLLEKRIGLRR